MDRETLNHLRRMVKNDEKYKKFDYSVRKNPNLDLPFEDLADELNRMHRTRSIRSLDRKHKRFTQTLIDARLQDQRYRSRCAEIIAATIPISGAFTETLNNLRDYLLIEYGKRIGGTKAERQQFMENVLRKFYRYIHNVDQLRDHARVIVDDIDKAGYTYNNLIELVKLLGKPEGF